MAGVAGDHGEPEGGQLMVVLVSHFRGRHPEATPGALDNRLYGRALVLERPALPSTQLDSESGYLQAAP